MANLELDPLKDKRVKEDLGRVIWWVKVLHLELFRIGRLPTQPSVRPSDPIFGSVLDNEVINIR